MIRFLLAFVAIVSTLTIQAQVDYSSQYKNGKELFQQGKYNLAMETFKPLLTYDQKNPYEQYATFYYGLSAYHQGYHAVAKDAFSQIKARHTQWEKMDEVDFWLGKIHFDARNYFQGLKMFQSITDKGLNKHVRAVKLSSLQKISDVETLRMMHEEYPNDPVIAKVLAALLSKNLNSADDRALLESLVARHKLNRKDYLPEAPESIMKDKYSVSVLMPFMLSTLEATPGRKRNQLILDFYEGMKLALDTLNQNGASIELRAYDTERNVDRIKSTLATEELKNTDLIVGPFFQDEVKVVNDFSTAQKINMIHPFSSNRELIEGNQYAFLFQPAAETLGRKSADYLSGRASRKNTMVFYGTSKKDSTMAASFIEQATAKGLKVVHSRKVATKDAQKILEILATPTEFDEFKYPVQFTLKKDSIGSIYVASDDALIYAKVVSAVENRADSITVVGAESWLDDPALDPEKYQNLGVTFASPGFVDTDNAAYRDFFRKFIKAYSRTPSNFARTGYELMMFFGRQLQANGVYFQQRMAGAEEQKGTLYQGFSFQSSRDNSLIPFVRFERGQLVLVEKR